MIHTSQRGRLTQKRRNHPIPTPILTRLLKAIARGPGAYRCLRRCPKRVLFCRGGHGQPDTWGLKFICKEPGYNFAVAGVSDTVAAAGTAVVGGFGADVGRGNHFGGEDSIIGRKGLEARSVVEEPEVELEIFSGVFNVD